MGVTQEFGEVAGVEKKAVWNAEMKMIPSDEYVLSCESTDAVKELVKNKAVRRPASLPSQVSPPL